MWFVDIVENKGKMHDIVSYKNNKSQMALEGEHTPHICPLLMLSYYHLANKPHSQQRGLRTLPMFDLIAYVQY